LKKLVLLLVSILVISALILGSCGEPEPTETTTPTTPTTTQPTTTEPTTTEPTTPSGPVSGGILRGIITAGPLMMSYRGQMGPGDHTYVMPAVEYLVEPYVDEEGNRGWIPFLCESYNIDPEGKTFTFKLRDGIKFQDGSILDAEVVKWNFQQQIDSGWLQDADKVVSIETPDDSTVVINFTEYSNQYEFNWGWTAIWSKAAWEANAGTDKSTTSEQGIEWAVDHVVGTGPFVLKEYERDVSITWEKFDDYWQEGKPYLDGLEFQIVTEATTASALLQAGDIDLWYQGNSAQDWAELEPKGYIVKTYWPGLPMALWGNTVDPDSKWQDIRVREALEYALDKPAMAEALGLGYYVPLAQIAPSTEWGYIPDLPTRGYDPVKARELLADAGYEDGLPVTLLIQSVPANIDAGEFIKGYLDEAGFSCDLDIADPGRYFGSVFGTGWEDLVLMFYGMDVNYLATYMSWFSSDPKSNLASFERPPEQVAMDKEAVLIPDTQGQIEMTERLCRYLYEQARLCPLWWVPAATVSQDYVHHEIYRHGFIRVDWENVWMDAH
jgi:peptide/nickel transport system substrate-binding protein